MKGSQIAEELPLIGAASKVEKHISGVFVGDRVFSLHAGCLHVCESGSLERTKVPVELGATTAMTREEEMLLERVRGKRGGIHSFSYAKKSNQLLLSALGSVYTLDLNSLESKEVPTSVSGARLHTSLSDDGGVLGFVRGKDLFVTEVATGKEIQVSESKPNVISGAGDFIHQEEFSAYRSYWIAPKNNASKEIRILYLEFDETDVGVFNIVNPGIDGSVDAQRYARTGTTNSTISVHLATVSLSDGTIARKEIDFDFGEYIPRGGWSPNSDFAWLTCVNREQTHARLLRLDFETPPTVLYEEKSDIFIDVVKELLTPLYHFKDGKILISSEKSGFAHLYALDPKTSAITALTSGDWLVQIPKLWSVTGALNLWIDENTEEIVFAGRKAPFLQQSIFSVSYAQAKTKQITPDGYDFSEAAVGSGYLIAERSSLTCPPESVMYKLIDSSEVVSKKLSVPESSFKLTIPQLFSIESNGFQLHGITYFPPDFDKKKRYPTVIYTYGGPHVQLVKNHFNLTQGPLACKLQWLASKGYVVSILDNRGSSNRGTKFEAELFKKMGTVRMGLDCFINELF